MEHRAACLPDPETHAIRELERIARRIEWVKPEEAASMKRIARELEAHWRERAAANEAPYEKES